MISIIISSYREELFNTLTTNIDETIGVEYEIIRIENKRVYSISEAYNLGIERASYEFLLFLHEDVLFHSDNWGGNLIAQFRSIDNVGLIGIAGSKIVTNYPIGWTTGIQEYDKMQLIQRFKDGRLVKHSTRRESPFDEVKVLDGVLLFTHMDVISEHLFSEEINGFHFYDLELCHRLNRDYKLIVTYDFFLEHFSEGSFDSSWLKYALEYSRRKPGIDLMEENLKNTIRITWYTHLAKYSIDLGLRIRFILSLGISRKVFKLAARFLLGKP